MVAYIYIYIYITLTKIATLTRKGQLDDFSGNVKNNFQNFVIEILIFH